MTMANFVTFDTIFLVSQPTEMCISVGRPPSYNSLKRVDKPSGGSRVLNWRTQVSAFQSFNLRNGIYRKL